MHGEIMKRIILVLSPHARFYHDLLALSLALLQVFLEGWSSGNGLAGVLIYVGFGVAGISHPSLSELLVDGGGTSDLSGGDECRGGGHEGGESGELVLWSVHKDDNRQTQ